jgi:RNA polymerase sigma-70 factor (ECF subfamily)
LRHPGADDDWQRFTAIYTPLLYYWARRVGLHDADAADLVQDVFATLVRVLPHFHYQQQKSFRGWLRTLTINKWRERQRRPRLVQNVDAADLAELTTAPEAETFWETEYRQQLAERAMDVMRTDFEPTTWQAFYESSVNGRPIAEVAQQLGLQQGAVRAAKFRVLRRLRQELAGLLD